MMTKTRRGLVLRLISALDTFGDAASLERDACSEEGEPVSAGRLRTRRIEGSAMTWRSVKMRNSRPKTQHS